MKNRFVAGALFAGSVLLLAACVLPQAGKDRLPPVGEQYMDQVHADCIRKGGEFVPGRSGGFLCMSVPRDAGNSCNSANDCESECLARSRTCAPVKPLLGCNDILTGSGVAVRQCVE